MFNISCEKSVVGPTNFCWIDAIVILWSSAGNRSNNAVLTLVEKTNAVKDNI